MCRCEEGGEVSSVRPFVFFFFGKKRERRHKGGASCERVGREVIKKRRF